MIDAGTTALPPRVVPSVDSACEGQVRTLAYWALDASLTISRATRCWASSLRGALGAATARPPGGRAAGGSSSSSSLLHLSVAPPGDCSRVTLFLKCRVSRSRKWASVLVHLQEWARPSQRSVHHTWGHGRCFGCDTPPPKWQR